MNKLNKDKFLKMNARQRWDFIKNSKVEWEWHCINCDSMVDDGSKPTRVMDSERFCSNCHWLLTRRTGGGMNDPCNYYPGNKRHRTEEKESEMGKIVDKYYGKGKVIGKDGDYVIIKVKAPKTTYFGDPAFVRLGKYESQEQRENWDKEIGKE